MTIAIVVIGSIASIVIGIVADRWDIHINVEYLPTWIFALYLAWVSRRSQASKYYVGASVVFVVSLVFHSIDMMVCEHWPLGTHFLWHLANDVVLFCVLMSVVVLGRESSKVNEIQIWS